jgi:hypothetical protein
MKRSRAYFFTGIDGLTGHRFRVENRPRRSEFEDLFDSIPFILESADSAQENQSGHIRLETDTRAKGRMAPLTDGWSRSVQGHQLPVVRNQSLAGDVVVSTGVYNGIRITDIDFVDPLTGRVRRDFMVENGLSLTSTDGAFVITPIVNGFDLTASSGLADTYKVMGDAGDATPGYLAAKIEPSLEISVNNKIQVRHEGIITGAVYTHNTAGGIAAGLQTSSTNTIELIPNASLSANVRYNGTWFTEDATGLRLLPHSITQNEIALGTILGTNINTNPGFFFGDGLNHDGTRMYARVQKSIQLDPAGGANIKAIQLVGDSSAPGNSKYYGTDATGTKGFYDILSDSKWINGIDNTAVAVKNANSNALAPYSVALGKESTPWIPTSVGYSTLESSETLQFVMRAVTPISGGVTNLQVQNAPWFIDIPDDSMFTIEGKVIAFASAVSNMNVFKFFAIGKKISGVLTIASILYDTPIAPFHVIQAGTAPYATAYTAEAADIDIQVFEEGGYIKVQVADTSAGVNEKTYWTGDIKLHVNGGAILKATYTP